MAPRGCFRSSATHSLKQLFEVVFSEENRLLLFIKTMYSAFIYQLLSAECNWAIVLKAYSI